MLLRSRLFETSLKRLRFLPNRRFFATEYEALYDGMFRKYEEYVCC